MTEEEKENLKQAMLKLSSARNSMVLRGIHEHDKSMMNMINLIAVILDEESLKEETGCDQEGNSKHSA